MKKSRISEIIKEKLKELLQKMAASLSTPEEETAPEVVNPDPAPITEPEKKQKKPRPIVFKRQITVKFIGKEERRYSSERELVEEITNRHLKRGHNFGSHNHKRVETHQELLQLSRKRLETVMKKAGSILEIEYIKRTTSSGKEYQA